eukprot:Hpha_TRINITY_DN14076_c0_g1::TRINITY_DN14076_c0_g1_i1::g.44383::m.44383
MFDGKMSEGAPQSPTSRDAVGLFLRYLDGAQKTCSEVLESDDTELVEIVEKAIPLSVPEQSGATPTRTHQLRSALSDYLIRMKKHADALRAPGELIRALVASNSVPSARPAPSPTPVPVPVSASVSTTQLSIVSPRSTHNFEEAGRVLGGMQAVCGAGVSSLARHGTALRKRIGRAELTAGVGKALTVAALGLEAAGIVRDWYRGLLTTRGAARLMMEGAVRGVGSATGAFLGAQSTRRVVTGMKIRDPRMHVAALLCGSVVGGAAAAQISRKVASAVARFFLGADDRTEALKRAYVMLGVQVDATDAELKSRYQYLAAKTHPDRGGDPEHFTLLRTAYELVTDSRRPPRPRL